MKYIQQFFNFALVAAFFDLLLYPFYPHIWALIALSILLYVAVKSFHFYMDSVNKKNSEAVKVEKYKGKWVWKGKKV